MNKRFLSLLCFCLNCFTCRNTMALLCLSSDSNYQVVLSDDKKIAQVFRGLETVRFGKLACQDYPTWAEPQVGLVCRSENVADAGFEAMFFSDLERKILSVNLNEISFFGIKNIAKLSCLDVTGSLQKRVLWITGENDIAGIQVSAGGEIELNIKTVSGTGYAWELQPVTFPELISLVEKPYFVPTTELMGGVGVTRFRFRLDSKLKEGFTLVFQLRRPWEENPLKQFQISFEVKGI